MFASLRNYSSLQCRELVSLLAMQTTDKKLIAKADKPISAADRLVVEKHCRPLSSMLKVKPAARAAFKSNAAWSAARLKLKYLLQKGACLPMCALRDFGFFRWLL
jgi:hypothetical protein